MFWYRYLNSPDVTAACFDSEGFFETGDLAILQHGRYIFQGRADMDRQYLHSFLALISQLRIVMP